MKSMILGISASPQKGGKVETLVEEVLSASRLPSELVRLHDISVGPCKACNGCWAQGRVGAAVVAGSNTELAGKLGDALVQFMQNYGIKALGRITAAGANPCLGCKDSLNDCEYSAVVAQYGLLERIGTALYNPIENQLHALKNARVLGQRLGHKVNHLMARGYNAEAV